MSNDTETNRIAARDDNRKLALLLALRCIPKPTERDLTEATGIPARCIHAMFDSLSKLGVTVERVNGRRYGFYTIADSGAYCLETIPNVLQKNCPAVFQQIHDHAQQKREDQLVAESKHSEEQIFERNHDRPAREKSNLTLQEFAYS